MSNTNYEPALTNDDMKDMLAEDAGAQTSNGAPEKKKNIFYRVLAAILTVAPIVLLCVLPMALVLGGSGYTVYGKSTLLDAFLALFKKDGISKFYADAGFTGVASFEAFKLFGLPVLSGSGIVGKIMGAALYAFPVIMLLTVIFMVIALISGKKAPAMARVIAFFNFCLYTAYAIAIYTVYHYYEMGTIGELFKMSAYILIVALAGANFLFYLILAFMRAGKASWFTLVQLLLTLAFSAVCIYGVIAANETLGTLKDFYKYAIFGLLVIALLAFGISLIRLGTKKGLIFDLIRYIFNLIVAGAFIYFVFAEKDAFKKMQLYVIIAAAIALLQVVLCILVLRKKNKKAKAVETTEEDEAPAPEQETGAYMEAVPYTAPQEAASVAEDEIKPVPSYNFSSPEAEEETSGQGKTADYDFYNSRSFDPFIASLNGKEREQFTDIFILKYKGDTKNLPDYVVGGDNKEFFRKVFIYLGQYRDRIPDSLLAKMYQFAAKK